MYHRKPYSSVGIVGRSRYSMSISRVAPSAPREDTEICARAPRSAPVRAASSARAGRVLQMVLYPASRSNHMRCRYRGRDFLLVCSILLMWSFSAATITRQTCLQGISDGGVLGKPSSLVGSCSGQNKTDDSFVCGGIDHFVEIMNATGTGDFTLTVSLVLEHVGSTAASIVFFSSGGEAQNHVGIDSWFVACTGPSGESPCGAGPHLPTKGEKAPALVAGEKTNLTFARTGDILSVKVNEIGAFTTTMAFAVDGFALRPWRSTMRIYRFDVCAEHFVPAPPPPPPPLPTVTVFSPGEAGVPVYRIPALCSAGPALVAFIEGRLGGDFSIKKLMTKRSLDGGDTWSDAVVVPNT